MKRYLLGLLTGILIAVASARAEPMDVTAYTLSGKTASGTIARPGSAACPPWYAFGKRLHLSGKFELDVTCEDHYAYWLSPRIDVWTRYYREAIAITGTYDVTVSE